MNWLLVAGDYLLAGATCLIAYRNGGAPERLGALAIAVWVLADPIYHWFASAAQYNAVDPGHVVLDIFLLLAWLGVAVRANRIWPMGAAGLQLIVCMGHFAALTEQGGMQRAYFAMTQVPPIFELLLLLVGTISHRRRIVARGPYRDWRRQ